MFTIEPTTRVLKDGTLQVRVERSWLARILTLTPWRTYRWVNVPPPSVTEQYMADTKLYEWAGRQSYGTDNTVSVPLKRKRLAATSGREDFLQSPDRRYRPVDPGFIYATAAASMEAGDPVKFVSGDGGQFDGGGATGRWDDADTRGTQARPVDAMQFLFQAATADQWASSMKAQLINAGAVFDTQDSCRMPSAIEPAPTPSYEASSPPPAYESPAPSPAPNYESPAPSPSYDSGSSSSSSSGFDS